jgi:hypothetical protein
MRKSTCRENAKYDCLQGHRADRRRLGLVLTGCGGSRKSGGSAKSVAAGKSAGSRREAAGASKAAANVFRWPASAVGYPLTFRAVVTAAGVALDLDYPVEVQS